MGNPSVQSPDQIRRVPRLRFSWGAAADVRGEWRLGLFGYHIKGYPRELWILISVRGVLLWGGALAVAAYFLGAAAGLMLLARNPYNRVTYGDLVLPTRWEQIRPKRAEAAIAEGLHEFSQKQWGLALAYLQRGLPGKPDDLRARVSLAKIYAGIGKVPTALQLLREGVTYHGRQLQYLEDLAMLARYLEDYAALLAVADEVEGQRPPPEPAVARWIDRQRVFAWEQLGQTGQILALRERRRQTPLIALDQAWARILAAEGKARQALDELQADPARFGLPAERLALQFTLARAAGDKASAEKALRDWQALNRRDAAPRMEELFTFTADSDRERLRDRAEQFFLDFAGDHQALLVLLQRMLEKPSAGWQAVVWEAAWAAHQRTPDIRVLYLQYLMQEGRLTEAQREFPLVVEQVARSHLNMGSWNQATSLLLNLLATGSESARAQIRDFCNQHTLPPTSYHFMLRCLRRAGQTVAVQDLLSQAREHYPVFSDEAGKAPVGFNLAGITGEPVPASPPEPPPAKPVSRLPKPPAPPPRPATELLRQIDQALATGENEAAGRWLYELGQNYPELHDGEKGLLRQVRWHALAGEQPELTATLHLYLDLKEVNLAALRDFALQWENSPQAESALTLAREVAARFPAAKWAAILRDRLQTRLRPAPAAGGAAAPTVPPAKP